MTGIDTLRFDSHHRPRPRLGGIDVVTDLAHFAIITWLVDPDVLRRHIHPRFEPVTIDLDGRTQGLVSVVPFFDEDFHFARFPRKTWAFPQTNYRAYVRDRLTGEHVVWFFATALDTPWITIPRNLWRLPWEPTAITFDVDYDETSERYRRYAMEATGEKTDALLELRDTGGPVESLAGFDDLESGLFLLTHPTKGYYYRRDGKLGSYTIWHERLELSTAEVETARFDLLARLGLVPRGDHARLHSAMVTRRTEFAIYLPPRVVGNDHATSQ